MDIYRLLGLYKATIDERRPFEGNTLTESETKVLLEDGLIPKPDN